MSPRVIVVAALLAACSFVAKPTHADPPNAGVTLSWVRGTGADTCSSSAAIARDVVGRLGRDPFGAGNRWIEAVATHVGAHWRAQIFVRDSNGTLVGSRELTNDDTTCAALEDATSLAIALAIDPDAVMHLAVPSRAPTSEPQSSESPAPISSRQPSSSPTPCATCTTPSEFRLDGSIIAQGSLAIGLLPGPSPGASLVTDVHLVGRLSITTGFSAFPEVRTTGAAQVGFGLWAFTFGGCIALVRTSRVRLQTCGFALAGAIHSVVYSPIPNEPGQQPWVAAALRVGLSVRIAGPFVLEAGLDGFAPITEYRFFILGHSEALFSQNVAASGHVGAGVIF